MLFIVANAAVGGRRAGVVAAAGMSTGLAVHSLAAAVGLGALIQAAPQVLNGVRVAGAAFLLYLAYLTWRASRQEVGEPDETLELPKRTLRRTYLMATLTNLANPKVILFYLAFVPQFITSGAGLAGDDAVPGARRDLHRRRVPGRRHRRDGRGQSDRAVLPRR